MKYIYSGCLFLIFIFTLVNVFSFNSKQDVTNINMSDKTINKLVIDLKGANVSVSTSVDNDIKLEHIYSEKDKLNSNLYSYNEGDTLYINEYPYNKTNTISQKETLNIYVPEQYKFDQIEIKNENGRINVDNLKANKLEIESKTGNVDIRNTEVPTISIDGDRFGVNLSNIIAQKLSSSINDVQFNLSNSMINNVDIKNKEKSAIIIDELISENVQVNGKKTSLTLTLNQGLNYNFITKKRIINSKLKVVEGGYQFQSGEKTTNTNYKIGDVENIKIKFEKVEGVKDEQ